jgi:hypothetical protein
MGIPDEDRASTVWLEFVVRVALEPSAPPATITATAALPTATSVLPTATATSAPKILWQDAFDNPRQQFWYIEDHPDAGGQMNYTNGRYRIRVTDENLMLYSVAPFGKSHHAVRIEVDAQSYKNRDVVEYGVFCRMRTNGDFYALTITNDGQAYIAKSFYHPDEPYEILAERAYSAAIKPNSARNRIQAECDGPTLTLMVNDEVILQAEDDTWRSGGVGILAASWTDADVEVLFDNFVLARASGIPPDLAPPDESWPDEQASAQR